MSRNIFWAALAAGVLAITMANGVPHAHAQVTIDTQRTPGRITTTIAPTAPGVTVAPPVAADEILICAGNRCRAVPAPMRYPNER